MYFFLDTITLDYFIFYDKKLRSVCQYKYYCDIKTNISIIKFYFLSLNLIS